MGLKYILQLADYHTIAAMQLIEKVPEGRYYGRILFKANFKSVSRRSDTTSNPYIKQFSEVCIKIYRTPIIFIKQTHK